MGHGREDYRQAFEAWIRSKVKTTDGSTWNQTMGSNRTVTLMRELAGKADPEPYKQRERYGHGLVWMTSGNVVVKLLDTLVSDVVQDRGREYLVAVKCTTGCQVMLLWKGC